MTQRSSQIETEGQEKDNVIFEFGYLRKQKKISDFQIQTHQFHSIVKEVMQQDLLLNGYKIQAIALVALQDACEAFIINRFMDREHCLRMTKTDQDMS